ncbi:uncharacterized protein PAC_03422 [Phialocephala subalpina]|uniref:Cytochrome b561 domain-containing protein n=1 Tax=Phialocephala subalpina TaxID=576137 RepID=A0A1L7WLC1_9HELO|nr:uncharacterized protein PAC_03422 [Phialocephala subalpina]
MKTSWFPLLSVWLLNSLVAASSPLQFCSVSEPKKTDLCFAVASSKNSTTQKNDLSLHISAKFVVDATGWAAVGIGEGMDNALMFVMYPGGEEGRITVSVRTTKYHNPPQNTQTEAKIHVTKAWIDENGLHNAQIMCYNCESWHLPGSELDVTSSSQPWIWATNWQQQTHSDDVHMKLQWHDDRGRATLNMAASYSDAGEGFAQVSTQRISMEPSVDEPGLAPGGPITTEADEHEHEHETEDDHPAPKKHHKHSLLGLVSIHGFLLALGFFALTFGVLVIRSGMAIAFKLHWVIQTVAGSAIVLGCLMGIYLSYKHGGHFNTYHQWIGLSILPSIIVQGLLGYLHHVNYVKHGRRTAVSHYHLWIGRAALLVGNLNVGFGLKLAGSESFKWFVWYAGVIIQLSVLIPMWYFWRKGKTILDVVRDKPMPGEGVRYESVEQDAFIVDDELDDLDDEGRDDDKKITGKDL